MERTALQTGIATTEAIAEGEGRTAILHALDHEDVQLSEHGLRLIRNAAKSVMQRVAPSVDADSLTLAQAVSLFVDHVFWDEESGGLYMCCDLNGKGICLPIPKEHWSVVAPGGRVH